VAKKIILSARLQWSIIIIVLICAAFWLYQKHEEWESKNRISESELRFEYVSLKTNGPGSYDMVGRIYNKSNFYTLKGVQLKFRFRDCEPNNESNCVVIAEENKHLYINIPPKQARDFKLNIVLYSDLKFI
jgi:hypothetical protein